MNKNLLSVNFLINSIYFLILLTNIVESGSLKKEDLPGSAALDNIPLIDGHNDLAYNLYGNIQNKIEKFKFQNNLIDDPVFGHEACRSCFTDLPRLRQGKIGGQFWAAYVSCNIDNPVTSTLDQIDVIKRLIQAYPNDLKFVTTADGILDAFKEKKIASLIGVEGGHSIANRTSILRLFYELGVRYMTLTHTCNLAWADSATVDSNDSPINNLTEFGKKIVLEMNRLGMLVDLAHVSRQVMIDAIDTSKAPVIFSHSSAKAIYSNIRNVDDYVLEKVKNNRGIVMVNFYSGFVAESNATIFDVINHINHIAEVAGIDHVGIGADYDGISQTPKGLEDVSKYADLFDQLKILNSTRWTIENLEKLAGRNLIRVFKEAEQVKQNLSNLTPDDDLIEDYSNKNEENNYY